MLPADILERTARFLHGARAADLRITPIEKGGSDRFFYRVRTVDDSASLIVACYGTLREENRHYVDIARFLHGMGIRVPEIYEHDECGCLIWMEDLGERDLWSFRNEPWPERRALYLDAIGQAVRLHTEAHTRWHGTDLVLQPVFDELLYRWEQDYFFENCLGRYFAAEAANADRAPLDDIAAELASLPRVLVHRDFQSQNILIHDGCACLIDFQGLRPGLAQYDLASLLHDPYVALAADERRELLAAYRSAAGCDDPAFERIYDLCAVQRLMQALGAYGFLGIVKGKTAFLQHVPAALESLKAVMAKIPALARLRSALDNLPAQ